MVPPVEVSFLSMLNVKYLRIFCDVISLLAQVCIVLSDRLS